MDTSGTQPPAQAAAQAAVLAEQARARMQTAAQAQAAAQQAQAQAQQAAQQLAAAAQQAAAATQRHAAGATQQTQQAKWTCVLCRERQSYTRIFVSGAAKDVRPVVQRLNMARGEAAVALGRGREVPRAQVVARPVPDDVA